MFSSSYESQATLVNPDPPTVLKFTKYSVLNTTLTINDKAYFKISTVDPAGADTRITDARTGELLVVINKKTFRPDTVKFAKKYGGKSVKQKEWLVEGKMANGLLEWTISTPIGNFVWRRDVVYRLALYPEYDPNRPVAYAQFPHAADRTIPFALVLASTRGTESFRDEIIASFLILEQSVRMEEKSFGITNYIQSSADAQMAYNYSAVY